MVRMRWAAVGVWAARWRICLWRSVQQRAGVGSRDSQAKWARMAERSGSMPWLVRALAWMAEIVEVSQRGGRSHLLTTTRAPG